MVRQKTANLKTAVLTSVNGPFEKNCCFSVYLQRFWEKGLFFQSNLQRFWEKVYFWVVLRHLGVDFTFSMPFRGRFWHQGLCHLGSNFEVLGQAWVPLQSTSAPPPPPGRFTHNHCACAPTLYIAELCEDCTVANEIDYAWTSIHDNGHVVYGVWRLTSTAHYSRI